MMLSPLAAALFSASALCLAQGLFHQLGHQGRRRSAPQRAFSVSLYAMGFQCFGTGILTDATDLSTGVQAQTVQFLGQAVALAAFMDFQQRTTANESRRMVIGLRLFAMVLVGLAASGLLVKADTAQTTALFSLPFARHYTQAALSPIGVIAHMTAVVAICRSHWKLWRKGMTAIEDAMSPALFVGMLFTLLCIGHDVLIRLGVIGSVFLVELGVVIGSLIASTDLVRRFVRERDDLQSKTKALERSYWRLSEARDGLVHTRRLAAIGELSATLAHEVRNPLAIIKNAGAALRRRETLQVDTQRELLRIVGEEVVRLTRLAADMLTYAKPLQLDSAPHCPIELWEAAIERARAEPEAAQEIAIDLQDGDAGQPSLQADGRLLVVALSHLVSNALWASPPAGRVLVGVQSLAPADRRDMPALELTVCDEGTGMDAVTRAKATEPFFSTRPQGTGLGLSIAQRVAEAHGGSLQLKSRPNGGTRVSMHLPLVSREPGIQSE